MNLHDELFTIAQIRRMRAAALRHLYRGGNSLNARGAAIGALTAMEPPPHWYERERAAQRAVEWAEKRLKAPRWVSAQERLEADLVRAIAKVEGV